MTSFNAARVSAFEALTATLDDLVGKKGVSEKGFQEEWLRRLATKPDMIADGWYVPPPHGMSVLFGDRVSRRSLREQKYWPGTRVIDWQNDLFFAYASPVGLSTGLPGDLSVTLYFGQLPSIRSHFKTAYQATAEVLDRLTSGALETSFDLVFAANTAFARAGCRNMVYSVTDPAGINFGHTFPAVKLDPAQKELTVEQRDQIRTSRLYLNAVTKWSFADHLQFTFEPQLASLFDAKLPKVNHHYLARKHGETFDVCRNIDTLLKRFDLV